MRQLFCRADTIVRFVPPDSWGVSNISKVTLRLLNRSGVTLLSAEVDPSPADVVAKDSPVYSDTITIDTDIDPAPEPYVKGDPLSIVSAWGRNLVSVKGYAPETGEITVDELLDGGVSAGSGVYRRFFDFEVDLSDPSAFVPGSPVTLEWGCPEFPSVTELAELALYDQLSIPDFEKKFERLYPRAYDGLKRPIDRLADVYAAAVDTLRVKLLRNLLDVSRVRDVEFLRPVLMILCCRMWAANADGDLADERKNIEKQLAEAYQDLISAPVWVDADGNLTEETVETTDHSNFFERRW